MKKLAMLAAALAALTAGAALAHDRMGAGGPGFGPGGHDAGPGGHDAGPGFGPRGAAIDFAAIDADGDGTLTRAELLARGVERIAVFDLDGDGALSRAEIIAALPERRSVFEIFAADPREEAADRILATLGATAEGSVTVETVASRQVDMLLTDLDGNRDDALSADEAAAGERRTDHGPRGPMGLRRF